MKISEIYSAMGLKILQFILQKVYLFVLSQPKTDIISL